MSGRLRRGLSFSLSLLILTLTPGMTGCFKAGSGSGKSSSNNPTVPISISNTSLPSATLNIAYTSAFSFGGGTNSGIVWSLTGGALPTGLVLSSSGVISGTPTVGGTFSITVEVTDSASDTASATFSLVVTYPSLSITTATLPTGIVGGSYSVTLAATGGSGTGYTYAVLSGSALSAVGLTLSPAGVISGTPTATETVASFTVKVTDSAANTATAQFNLTINAALAIATPAGPLAAGTVGSTYSVTLQGTGGMAPYSWSITLGSLPAGLSLNASTGAITGTPTATGTSSITVKLTDSSTPSNTTSANFTIAIAAAGAITFTTTTLPSATISAAYSASVVATGGAGTLTYSLASGTLPAGLTLSSAGAITGTPTAVGTSTIAVKATDAYNDSATSGSLSLVVNYTTLSITTTNLPSASVDVLYTQTFVATGGSGNYSWSITSGLSTLQGIGMSFTTAGVLSGTPHPPAGTYPFTVQVTDTTNSKTSSAPYTFLVVNGITPSCTHNGSANSILNGNYAFLLSGFDPNGNKYESIGDFKADGSGNITGGNGDVNSSGFATSGEQQYTFTGTYSIGDSANDNRGITTWTNTNTTATGLPATSIYCFASDAITSGVAYSGRIIEADGSGFVLTGYFQIQNPADFTNAAVAGGFAFGIQGATPGSPLQRSAAIGQFTLNGTGGVSGGQLDTANYSSGSMSTTYVPAIAINSSGSSYSIASSGRGTLTVNTGVGTVSFVIYAVATGSKLFMLSSGNIYTQTLLAGQAIQQTTTSYTTANVKAAGAYRAAGTTSPSQTPVYDDVLVGQLVFDGAGNLSVLYDENKGGAITGPVSTNTTYSVTSSGYIKLTSSGGSNLPNFYLYAPGSGFGMDASTGIHFYYLATQTVPLGGFTTTSMVGNYAIGTITPLAYIVNAFGPYPTIFDASGTFTTSSYSVISDTVTAPGLPYDVQVGASQTSSFYLDPTFGGTNGRFIGTTGGVESVAGYIVSNTQVFMITATSGQDGITLESDHQ